MVVLLCISFVVMLHFTNIKNEAIQKYPFIEDCTQMIGSDDDAFMQKAATLEYLSNTALEEAGRHATYDKGYVQCFCNAEALDGAKPDKMYEYHSEDYAVC